MFWLKVDLTGIFGTPHLCQSVQRSRCDNDKITINSETWCVINIAFESFLTSQIALMTAAGRCDIDTTTYIPEKNNVETVICHVVGFLT